MDVTFKPLLVKHHIHLQDAPIKCTYGSFDEEWPVLRIKPNPPDLRGTLVLILAGVRYDSAGPDSSVSELIRVVVMMNPIAVVQLLMLLAPVLIKHLYAARMMDFIDHLIKCSMVLEGREDISSLKAPSVPP